MDRQKNIWISKGEGERARVTVIAKNSSTGQPYSRVYYSITSVMTSHMGGLAITGATANIPYYHNKMWIRVDVRTKTGALIRTVTNDQMLESQPEETVKSDKVVLVKEKIFYM